MNSSKTSNLNSSKNEELPFNVPSQWYKYRCLSCDHSLWVEDIIVDAFPPERPGGFPVILCHKCNGRFKCDESVHAISSFSDPNVT